MQAKTPRILIVARDGSSGGHLDYGRFRMMEEGYDLTVAAPAKKPLQTVVHYPQTIVDYPAHGPIVGYYERPGYVVQADAAFDDIEPTAYDGLLVPGGRGPEYLQKNKRCLEIVRYFVDSGKPVGALCHGPLLLVAAGVTGRRMSCVELIETDVIASGNTLVNVTDEAVFDGNLVTAFRIPYAYYAWIRGFLDLMQQRGFKRRKPAQPNGARILMIAGDYAASAQLQYARYRMLEERFDVTLAAPVKKLLDTSIDMREEDAEFDIERLGYWMEATATFEEVDPTQYDGLIIPGWRDAEYLRFIPQCVQLVRHFVEANKPVASICRGPSLLLAAGVKGRRMTGLDVIRRDITMSGNTYVEAGGSAVVDGNIATVSSRPHYHVWMQAFLSLLEERAAKAPAAAKTKAPAMA
ncbi:MAG: DJ-1/PfpI family protein [Hyphomicrobiales bacterium]|nr:DJ-1/PfpI family protein [Hyphomicrobiales bacterium]